MKKNTITIGSKVWMILHQEIGIVSAIDGRGNFIVSMTYVNKESMPHLYVRTGECYTFSRKFIVLLP